MKIAELIDKLIHQINPDFIFCLIGLLIFTVWFVRTSFGRNALIDSRPRRNNLSAYIPFIVLLAWVGVYSITFSITEKFFSELPDWQTAFIENLIQCICGSVVIVASVFIA